MREILHPVFSYLIALGLLLLNLSVIAQERGQDLSKEVSLGLSFRQKLLVNHTELTTGREVETGQRVFQHLIRTSYVRQGDNFPYQLTVINSDEVNASSYAGGQIIAEGGIARLMSHNPGLWAAILGHEIAHTILHHHFRAHQHQEVVNDQVAHYQRQQAAGDQSAVWALLALQLSGRLLQLKLSRDEEHQADRLGLLIMAEAGFHPDFAIAGFRRIGARAGDISRLRAFLTSHPRWETREKRQTRAYDEAVAIFESNWPNAARSPGGQPPIVATILGVGAERVRAERAVLIRGTLHVKNAQSRTIYVVVRFFHQGGPVKVADRTPEHFNLGGNGLETGFRAQLTSTDETTGVAIKIPTAVIGIKERRFKARLSVLDGDGNILTSSGELTVNFPD